MKKKYNKPEILFENFEMSQRIAGECEGIANNTDESLCSVDIPELGKNVFTVKGICKLTGPGWTDRICYHAPSESNNVFTS